MIPTLLPLKLPERWTLQKLRPPSRKKLLLLEDFSVEGSASVGGPVNAGCSYRLEYGEPVLAAGDGKIHSVRSLFPAWKYTPGSILGGQPTKVVTINHGNGIETIVHGLVTCSVQNDQRVHRGDVLGYLLTDEVFFQIKWLGIAHDPKTLNRHFKLQNSRYAAGRAGYIREAADRLPRSFVSHIAHIIVDGIRYFVNLLGYRPPVLANIDFNGSDITVTEGRGKLNYTAFQHWSVVDNGNVDLVGHGFYDFIPANGLYVDMAGSTNNGGATSWYGRLESQQTFNFTAGHQFRLSWRSAGNQRLARASDILNYKAGTLVDATISITDWQQPFQDYSVLFTGDGSSGKISFRKIALESDPGPSFGSLLDSIILEDLTLSSVLLSDSFDDENVITTERYWGPAAVGATGDYWNIYTPVSFTKDWRACYCTYGYSGVPEICFTYSSIPYIYLKDYNQVDTPIWLERIAPLVNNCGVTATWNGMLQSWIGGYDMGGVPYDSTFRLHGLPPGTYELYLYSDQTYVGSASDYYIQVDSGAIQYATNDASGATSWIQDDNFVLFSNLAVVPGSTVRVEVLGYLAGLQIRRV